MLKKYLPPKRASSSFLILSLCRPCYHPDEYVVFITPTKLQLSMFEKFLSNDKLDSLIRDSTAESLALINMLTKISNSPILLKATADQARLKAQQGGNIAKWNAIEEALQLLPERAQVGDVSLSGKAVSPCVVHSLTVHPGKLSALATLLRALHKVRLVFSCLCYSLTQQLQHTEEKCIIVSHYTSTLNIIEAYCKKKTYTYHRLDG